MAPAPADQGQVGDVAHPDLIGRSRGRLTKQRIFGHDRCRVSHGCGWALGLRSQRPQTVGVTKCAGHRIRRRALQRAILLESVGYPSVAHGAKKRRWP